MTTSQLLAEAEGYFHLGMNREAEAALRKVMAREGNKGARDHAQSVLVSLLHADRFLRAAELGADFNARGRFRESAIINTALALPFLGRFKEALETFLLLEKCGVRIEVEAYQMACFAAQLGEFTNALR